MSIAACEFLSVSRLIGEIKPGSSAGICAICGLQTEHGHVVAVSGRLDVLRHGLDQDLIMLRMESLQAAKGGGS